MPSPTPSDRRVSAEGPAGNDPRPEPPEKPLPSDCCEGGCDPCVHDTYQEALEHYARELARWRERHPHADA